MFLHALILKPTISCHLISMFWLETSQPHCVAHNILAQYLVKSPPNFRRSPPLIVKRYRRLPNSTTKSTFLRKILPQIEDFLGCLSIFGRSVRCKVAVRGSNLAHLSGIGMHQFLCCTMVYSDTMHLNGGLFSSFVVRNRYFVNIHKYQAIHQT